MNLLNRYWMKAVFIIGAISVFPGSVQCSPFFIKREAVFNPKDVPQPVLDGNKELIPLYYKAWNLAFRHIKYQDGLPQSPYMDEAFDDSAIWIWDTCFMLHFCKYAPVVFPGIQSLNNFYVPIHDGKKTAVRIEIPDNPPLFAWTEYEYYKLTGDRKHIIDLLYKKQYLQKHYEWFNVVKPNTVIANSAPTCLEKRALGYKWEGGRSGMDNTPRGRIGNKALLERPNNPDMLWLDAIAQQGLSALYISRLFKEMNDRSNFLIWKNKYQKIKRLVNCYYWNEKDGIYYDIDEKTLSPIKVITPASFWPMLAEMCSRWQAQKMVRHLTDKELGGKIPWVSLARNDADFCPDGHYWRGSVWLPTAYMGVKALEKYGYFKQAYTCAFKIVEDMEETYKEYLPHSIWECYNPNDPIPAKTVEGKDVRHDFCGWSALGPISLLIENVLGFYNVDAGKKLICWSLNRTDRNGIKNLHFGQILTSLIYSNQRIDVRSNKNYTLIVNGRLFRIKSGHQLINL